MRQQPRSPLQIPNVLLLPLAVVVAAIGYRTASAATHERAAAATVVRVTAGKPSEFHFTLSASSARSSTVTFKVTNRGSLVHRFRVCTAPAATAKLGCAGPTTRSLAPGQTASLTVVFKKAGTYTYLDSLAGHAAKGMKGLFGVTMPAPAPSTTTSTAPTTTHPATTPSTTTPTTTTPGSTGDRTVGAALFVSEGCSTCHTVDEVRAYNSVGPNLNSTHPEPFPHGPLSATQLENLAAYVNGTGK